MEESERDIELERRRDTEFGEWAQSRTGGAVRGGERVKGVGGSGLVFFFFFFFFNMGSARLNLCILFFGLNGVKWVFI